MTYCHVYETWREAQYYFSEFVKENGEGKHTRRRISDSR